MDLSPLHNILGLLDRFADQAGQGGGRAYFFAQSVRGLLAGLRLLTGGVRGVANAIREQLNGALAEVAGYFQKLVLDAIDFDLSITGLLGQAEKTRKFFSEMADEMNFFSSATGNTSEAMGILFEASSKSAVGYQTLKSAFGSMVDAGADSKKFIKEMLPLIGDFEAKTGVGAQQFGTMATKFQQMFGEKKGITKDIQDLQKALIGTGLKGAQLEQTMQGLTEAAEKLGFATQSSTLNIKELSKSYSQTTAVFKAFGVNTQTTSNFLNGLVDPENVEKNMLLMNKMGISYQEFNDMLNSGQGQDKFFDKILNNVGKVAQEASLIQDASTRYKYLKDTLGLPPEIANKLMKVTPSRMQAELRKIKREMEEAEKKEKWRKELKAREEKYEEAMMFLRMEMVKPLVDLINRNRGAIMRIMQALVPVFQLISEKLATFLDPFAEWLEDIASGINSVMSGEVKLEDFLDFAITDFMKNFGSSLDALFNDNAFINIGEQITNGLLRGAGKALLNYMDFMPRNVLRGLDMFKNILPKDDSVPARMIEAASDFGSIDSDFAGYTAQTVSKNILDALKTKRLDKSEKFNKDATINEPKTSGLTFERGAERQYKNLKEALEDNKKDDAIKSILALETELMENKTNKKEDIDAYIKKLQMDIFGIEADSGGDLKNILSKNKKNPKKPAAAAKPTVPKVDTATGETLKTVNESLSDAEVKAAVEKLMNNKNFMASVTTSLVSLKDKRITDLEKQVRTFTESEEKLKAEFNKLKDESTVGILMKWNNELFGVQDNSIKNILLSIDDSLAVEDKAKTGGTGQKMSGPSDISLFKNAISNSSSSSLTGSSDLTKTAGGTSIKNIQVKQALYLKSIADSTFDSAKYLRYIGSNLVFGPNGLYVYNNPNAISGLKRISLSGKEATGVLSGFDVVSGTTSSG